MEEINSKKTEAFLTAIKTLADEECKSIDEETERLRVERLRALQKEAEDRYKLIDDRIYEAVFGKLEGEKNEQ